MCCQVAVRQGREIYCKEYRDLSNMFPFMCCGIAGRVGQKGLLEGGLQPMLYIM